jgi:hypothetical protein
MKLYNFIKRGFTRLRKDGFPVVFNIIFGKYLYKLKPFVSPIVFESVNMYVRLGYWPKIKTPRSLNEKLVHQKLYIKNPLFSLVADKVKVRKYVADKLGDTILNDLYYVGNDPSLIKFENLPSQFVIKANHGSGWNIIVKDKSRIDKNEIVNKCSYWLGLKYSSYSNGYECHYDNIEPNILVEKFLEGTDNESNLDYKFYCFHGSVKFIAVDTNKNIRQNRYIYNTNWDLLDFTWPEFPQDKKVKKPLELTEMINIAENLAKDFIFCRIDLYLAKTGIKFGEITISPGGGWDKISPIAQDFKLGKFWS